MSEMIAILLLVFLFWGEPDIWDNLHAWVMKKTSVDNVECVTKNTTK